MESKRLRLYSPHEAQKRFHSSATRYIVAAWGRQAGKSTAGLNHIIKYAWEHPGVTLWFVSPTYSQAKVQYRRALGMLWRCREILTKKNQTEQRLKFINGAQIKFISGQVLQNLRGETLHGAVIDEVRDQHPDLWPMVIRPMLSTTRGWAAFISTPNGFDVFYDLFERAQSDSSGLWTTMHAPSTANPLFSEEEAAQARASMSEAQYDQEINAAFRDLHTGKAYINYGEHNHRSTSPFGMYGGLTQVHPYLPILISPDFNLSPMAWMIGQVRNDWFYYFDELYLENSHTQEATDELIVRLKRLKEMGAMKLNPNVVICGDATSKAGQRAAAAKSDYDILIGGLISAGFTVDNRTPDSNPQVKDRVNTMNARLRAADGSVSFFFDPINCPHLKRDLQRVVWKKGAQGILDQTTDASLTHSSDGPGYSVCELAPIPDINPVGKVIIIPR